MELSGLGGQNRRPGNLGNRRTEPREGGEDGDGDGDGEEVAEEADEGLGRGRL